jgi:hypothetical protein
LPAAALKITGVKERSSPLFAFSDCIIS